MYPLPHKRLFNISSQIPGITGAKLFEHAGADAVKINRIPHRRVHIIIKRNDPHIHDRLGIL